MGESSATNRIPSGAEEFDRRMRSLDQPTHLRDDPLAELARLVGQEDPFRGVIPAARAVPPRPAVAPLRTPDAVALDDYEKQYAADLQEADFSDFEEKFPDDFDVGAVAGAPTDPAIVHGDVGHGSRRQGDEPGFAPISVREARPIEASADAWARGDDARSPGQ